MNEIVSEYFKRQWDQLSPAEKAMCVSYRKILLTNGKVNGPIVDAVSAIHAKYPDFHLLCMPSEEEAKNE